MTGEATIAVINEDKDFAEFKGKLRGKFVLSMAMRDVPAHFDSLGHRYTDSELADWASEIGALARRAETTNILFNNCYLDYAQTNARQLADLLNA